MPYAAGRIAMITAALAALAWSIAAMPVMAQSGKTAGTTAGRFTVENPTLENLGFEWAITGDANRNASVAVEFRRVGDAAWRKGLPLVRIGGDPGVAGDGTEDVFRNEARYFVDLARQRLRARAHTLWEAQIAHPFVRGIGDGTLPPELFGHWLNLVIHGSF